MTIVLQEKTDYQRDLTVLIRELDGITSDISEYVNFLIARRHLFNQVFLDGPASDN